MGLSSYMLLQIKRPETGIQGRPWEPNILMVFQKKSHSDPVLWVVTWSSLVHVLIKTEWLKAYRS